MDIILRVAASGSAAAEASKAGKRTKESNRYIEEMKRLKPKVYGGQDSAKKKFNTLYNKVFDLGEAAAKAAQKLIKQFENKVEEDTEPADTLEMLNTQLRWWNGNKVDHITKSSDSAYGKLFQAEVTWGYGTKLDEWIIYLDRALKGDVDEVRTASSPAGKGQKAVMEYLGKHKGEVELTDMAFVGMHFAGIQSAVEALQKKGLIRYEGTKVSKK